MDFINLPGLTGWPGTIITLIFIVAYGFYIKRSAKSKAEDLANTAYKNAIDAMQLHTKALEQRIKDTEDDYARLDKTLKALCTLLETKGIYVTAYARTVIVRCGTDTAQITLHSATEISEEAT